MNSSRSHSVFERMMNNSQDVFGSVDINGYFQYLSDACKYILGYESSRLIGKHFSAIIHPKDVEATDHALQEIFRNNNTINFNSRCVHAAGHPVYLHWSGAWSEDDEIICFVGRDVTEQKLRDQILREKEELYQALIEHGTDMLALFDEEINFIYSGGSTERILGYSPATLAGRSAFSLIHPDDVPIVQERLELVLASGGYTTISDFRFRHANGEWIRIETTLSNQLNNPAVRALVTSSRDITEKYNNKQKLLESEQRFKSMFDENPDAILIENREGIVIDANYSAEVLLGIPKQHIINRHFSNFLPPDALAVCTKHLQNAFKGNTVKFELETVFEGHGRTVLDFIKIPVNVKGNVLAVHTIVKNITEVSNYYNTIQNQAKKLTTIFESITDAFCTLDRDWKYTYANSEFECLLKYRKEEFIGKNFFDIYPEADGEIFHRNYQHALETGNSVHFQAYSENLDLWLNVKAFPSEEGLSVYFDDITQIARAQQEVKKLALVASNTTNGVIITDPERKIEWVNEGFTRLTGYSFTEALGKIPSELLHRKGTELNSFESVKDRMLKGKPVTFETQNHKKTGEVIWLSVQVNPVHDEYGKLINFVTIQTDITEKKESEANLLKLTQDLYKQNSDLQQFTYIVSHNLRAPVANALGLAGLLTKVDKASPLYEKTLINLNQSVMQLDTVLKDMNTILSIRDTKGNIDKEKVEIKPKIQQALLSLQEHLQKCDGEVTIDIAEDLSAWANKAYIYSIFYNLLSNAIKYRSAERTLKVHVACVNNTTKNLVISFSDNGSGFDMQKAGDQVFKLYKRFHLDKKGRGIGLYLIKTHLEAMNGHIEVASQPGVGTKFLILLPKESS